MKEVSRYRSESVALSKWWEIKVSHYSDVYREYQGGRQFLLKLTFRLTAPSMSTTAIDSVWEWGRGRGRERSCRLDEWGEVQLVSVCCVCAWWRDCLCSLDINVIASSTLALMWPIAVAAEKRREKKRKEEKRREKKRIEELRRKRGSDKQWIAYSGNRLIRRREVCVCVTVCLADFMS